MATGGCPTGPVLDPALGLVVGDAEQEEHIGRVRAPAHTEPHVVGVDQRRRCDGQVQAARRLDQARDGRIQGQQQLAESNTGGLHVVRFY